MKNDRLILDTVDVGSEGEGIMKRPDGYAYFVPGAVPGDRAEILVLKENKSYGYGKLLRVVRPSPQRVEPACPVFGKCGGCAMLCCDYSLQLELKERKVRDCLTRLGGIEAPLVTPCVPSEPNLGCRNKAQYPVARAEGRLAAGFYAPHSHRVVPSRGCLLQKSEITALVNAATDAASDLGIEPYDEKTGRGCLRHIYVRSGKDEDILVFVAAHDSPAFNTLAERLSAAFPRLVGVALNLNPKATNLILGSGGRQLWGRDHIIDEIGEIKYKIHYRSFYQVNPYATKPLYDKAAEYCALTGGETVFDLYCGVGTISLYLACAAKKVIGVELVPEAVANARENARLSGITNAEFHVGKAEDVCPRLIEGGERADVVVLDPPRKGCDESLLKAAAAIAPKRIVYVSCNPATLARDAKILAAEGYSLSEATPFDQFPHTAHVETVASFLRQ